MALQIILVFSQVLAVLKIKLIYRINHHRYQFYFPSDNLGVVAFCVESAETYFLNISSINLPNLLAKPEVSHQMLLNAFECDNWLAESHIEKLLAHNILTTKNQCDT